MIKLYVYSTDNGRLLYEDMGLPEYVVGDLPENADFTLVRPPDYDHVWRWIENQWIADQPS